MTWQVFDQFRLRQNNGNSVDMDLSVGVRNGAAVLLHTLAVDSVTSNIAYEFSGLSIAAAFGGVLPDDWSVFITHDTGVALNATAGNHVMEYIGITYA